MPVPPPSHARPMFHGKTMAFWQWEQPLYDGTTDLFECVTRQDAAAVIPFLDAQTVLLTKQYQPDKTTPFFDFPGGRTDDGEELHLAVRREMQEEIGHQADTWLEWHRVAQHGQQRFEEALYLAKDLRSGFELHHDGGERIELIPTTWTELIQMCLKHKLRQPNIMLAILHMEFDPESKQRLHDWLQN